MSTMATLELVVTQRPVWSRVLRLPFVFRRHYKVMRRQQNGRIVSAYGAWLLAGCIVTFRRTA